jgi:hypothetical protein
VTVAPALRQRLNLFSFLPFSSLPCDGAIGAAHHAGLPEKVEFSSQHRK